MFSKKINRMLVAIIFLCGASNLICINGAGSGEEEERPILQHIFQEALEEMGFDNQNEVNGLIGEMNKLDDGPRLIAILLDQAVLEDKQIVIDYIKALPNSGEIVENAISRLTSMTKWPAQPTAEQRKALETLRSMRLGSE